MFAIIEAAGWPIWFLLIASVIALALIIERIMYLRRDRILPRNLLNEVIEVHRNGQITDELIETLAQNSPLGSVLAAGLRNADAPREVMKTLPGQSAPWNKGGFCVCAACSPRAISAPT